MIDERKLTEEQAEDVTGGGAGVWDVFKNVGAIYGTEAPTPTNDAVCADIINTKDTGTNSTFIPT